jgi:hypothetical protein
MRVVHISIAANNTISSSQLLHYAAPTELWIFLAYYYKYDASTEHRAAANGAVPYCKWYNSFFLGFCGGIWMSLP